MPVLVQCLSGRYRSTYEARRRSDHELAVAGRAFWASALAAYESIRPRDAAEERIGQASQDHNSVKEMCLFSIGLCAWYEVSLMWLKVHLTCALAH
jgi:hypothetical protein